MARRRRAAAGSRAWRRRAGVGRWAGALFLAILLAAACAERRPASIVLVTIDTLRADRLGCYGYFRDTSPELDAFARRAILFERAVAPMATTLPVHVSLMTSTYPGRHGVVGNFRHFRAAFDGADSGLATFAQSLRTAGYSTAAFVSAAPLKRETGIAVGFDHFDQPKQASRRAGTTIGRVVDWLDRAPEGPFFLWVHLWDPHTPYKPPTAYRKLFPENDPGLTSYLEERRFNRPLDPEIRRANSLYDGEVRYTDNQIGRLLRALEAGGLFEQAAIVVTADHGEGLGQHDWMDHGEIYNEQILVPLLVKLPGDHPRHGSRAPQIASLIDIVPTLAMALELPLPRSTRIRWAGRALLAEELPRHFAYAERVQRGADAGWEPGPKYALTGQQWKYFHLPQGEDQLFHLETDPHETRNVLAAHPELAQRLRDEVDRIRAGFETPPDASLASDELSPKLRQELESLGYVD